MVQPLRSLGTVVLGPWWMMQRTGYFRSAWARKAVTATGQPLPWYTYPSIEFLKHRPYGDRTVLEFGGGQSTLWWAARAKHVVTLEGDENWYRQIRDHMPANVSLHWVTMNSPAENIAAVQTVLAEVGHTHYDVIAIDGLYRNELVPLALQYLGGDGFILCDNAEGYGFQASFQDSGLLRIDFFGNAPGVVLPHATSLYCRPTCFALSAKHPIPAIAASPL
jgi:hypothetical protein